MKRTASSHTAALRAKGLQVLAEEPLPPIQRPTLEYRAVTDADRFEALEKLASSIAGWGKTSGWSTPRRQLVTARAHRTVNVNAGIVVMPEGYGKSSLVLHLIANGFKIVFCTKSNAQLLEKERELTVGWRDQPEQVRGIIGRPPKVTKFISKAQNLQAQLESLGVDAGTLKISSYELENPYGVAGLDEGQTIADLAALFQARGIDLDANEFFQTHYNEFKKPAVDGRNANITLITFAALQACCNNPHRRWWEVLGLIASVRTVYSHDRDRLLKISVPFERIAVIFDDPDRDDVDWLRGISQETAVRFMQNRSTVSDRRIAMETPSFWMKKFESVEAERLAALTAAANEKRRATPVHEIIKVQGSWWVKRPKKQTVGYRLRDRCKAKVIVTTTEILTAAYAYHSLTRNKLNVDQHIKLFRTIDSNVTAISTAITRGAAHAVLLPIIELLKEEFPAENVTLIADGLGCRFNLSNSKERWPRKFGQDDKLIPTTRRTGFYGQGYQEAVFG